MHLTKIEISNIRSLDEYTLEFPRGNNSAVITGDNGVGKTTFLRCLAMSLCDESSAAALFRELRGKFISNKSRNTGGIIKLYLRTKNYEHYIIETKIESMRKFEKLSQTLYKRIRQKHYSIINSNDFPWGQIFVCGYGAGMRTLGTSSIDHYAPIDAVYTLFRYDEPLLNPELFLRRVKDEDCQRRSKISPPGRSKTSPLNVMRYAVLGGCPGSP